MVVSMRMLKLRLLLMFTLQVATIAAEGMQGGSRQLLQVDGASNRSSASNITLAGGPLGDCCTVMRQLGFSSNLPVLLVKSASEITRDNQKVQACVCPNGLADADYNSQATINIRGGQTSHECLNEIRNTITSFSLSTDKTGFLGLPPAKKWVLYGPQNDTLGLHDYIGMEMSRAAGYYAPRTQYFEMFMFQDGTVPQGDAGDAYKGVYLCEEKITQSDGRLTLTDLSDHPADVSGGYLVEFEHGQNTDGVQNINLTRSNMQWNIYEPSESEITPAAVSYINGYFNNFEGALYGPDFDSLTQGWRQYGNDTSFVHWFLVEEVVKNPKHGYRGTTFATKDVNTKINFGPVWRLLQGFGQCCGFPVTGYQTGGQSNGSSGGSAISSEGWLFNICLDLGRCVSTNGHTLLPLADWFVRLMQDPSFKQSAASTYESLRKGPWSDSSIIAILDDVKTQLQQPGLRTFNRYPPLLLEPYGYPDAETGYQTTFSALQSWLLARLAWLDGAFNKPIVLPDGPPTFDPATGAQEFTPPARPVSAGG